MVTINAPIAMLGKLRTPRPVDEGRIRLLKAVADPIRLTVLDRLACCGDRCHCDFEDELGLSASRISFHLKVLRDAGLVESHRTGKRVRYTLTPDALDRLRDALPVRVDPADE